MSDAAKGISIRTEQDADERVQIKIVDGTTVSQVAQVDADKAVKVLATGHDTGGTNRTMLMTATGQVHVIVDETSSDETIISDPKVVTNLASNATDTHTYTVTAGKTLLLSSVFLSSAVRGVALLKIGPAGSEVTKFALYVLNSINSTARFGDPIPVPAGQNVLMVVTNEDKSASDFYTLINGKEV